MSPLFFSRTLPEPAARSVERIGRWRPGLTGVALRAPAGPGRAGRVTMAVRVRRLGRPVPMELRVSPWSGPADTHVELVPLRRVRPSRSYFTTGRRVLADVIGALGDPARATDRPARMG